MRVRGLTRKRVNRMVTRVDEDGFGGGVGKDDEEPENGRKEGCVAGSRTSRDRRCSRARVVGCRMYRRGKDYRRLSLACVPSKQSGSAPYPSNTCIPRPVFPKFPTLLPTNSDSTGTSSLIAIGAATVTLTDIYDPRRARKDAGPSYTPRRSSAPPSHSARCWAAILTLPHAAETLAVEPSYFPPPTRDLTPEPIKKKSGPFATLAVW